MQIKFQKNFLVNNENVILTSLVDNVIGRHVKFEDDGETENRIKVPIEQLLEILENRNDLLISFAQFCSDSKGKRLSSLWQRLLEIQLRNWSNETDSRYRL